MGKDYLGIIVAKMFTPEPPTWMGRGFLPHELWVGTEKGRLFSVDPDRGVLRDPFSVVGSGEAINGVAFTDKLMAVSNRSEVVIQERIIGIGPCVLDGGAHGVIASEGGRILAPMGSDGLLIVRPSDDGPPTSTILRSNGATPYFYQTVQIGTLEQGREWFASACRDDGIVLIPIGPGRENGEFELMSKTNPRTGKVEDIVSLCSLHRPGHPYALALLSIDKTVYFTTDVRTVAFTGIALDRMDGTPYSIHSAQGHLFILTSEKLYVMKDVAERAIRDPKGFSRDPIKSFSLEADAVDCSIVDDEYLLLVHDRYLTVNRVSELSQRFHSTNSTGGPKVGGPAEIFSIDPEFSETESERQDFQPSEMMATLIGAA
jgi:hypothetical protein